MYGAAPRGRAEKSRAEGRLLCDLVGAGDGGGDATPGGEGADDAGAGGAARADEVLEDLVDERLVEDALVAVALEVELERLQLDALRGGRVGEGDGPEVG